MTEDVKNFIQCVALFAVSILIMPILSKNNNNNNDDDEEDEGEDEDKDFVFPEIISIEGNIGSGKSTLLKLVKDEFKRLNIDDVVFVFEPVHVWEQIIDKDTNVNILETYYSNITKYAFMFQIMAHTTQRQSIIDAIDNYGAQNGGRYPKIIIMERSLNSNCNIFTKMLVADKSINDLEHQVYQIQHNTFQKYCATRHIYLSTCPEMCLDHKIKRNRLGEGGVDLSYLYKIHNNHVAWLSPSLCTEKKLYTLESFDMNNFKIEPGLLEWVFNNNGY